jgi:hypothetical protein
LTEAVLFLRRISGESFAPESLENGGGDNLFEDSFKKNLHFLDLLGKLAQEQLKSTILEAGWARSTDRRPILLLDYEVFHPPW